MTEVVTTAGRSRAIQRKQFRESWNRCWNGSAAVLRTEEELEADRAARPAPPPTTEEVLLELAADHEARLCEIELGV